VNRTIRTRIAAPLLMTAIFVGTFAGYEAEALAHNGEVHRPVASEFGFGPRASTSHLYTVTLAPAQPLRVRQLQTVNVRVADAKGEPIDGASIRVDGGMPEHGHGLPTQPRVTRALGNGVYEIEGVRFSMGGWWELKLAIETPAGADHVTFNLSL
jgi:hypothetical protein